MSTPHPKSEFLGLVPYEPTWKKMQAFAIERGDDALDQIWLLEHPPVFTQGMNGKAEHVLFPGDIPVVPIDRGGQVTYHGPGRLVVSSLLDLDRLKLGPRDLVCAVEKAIIATLADIGITAYGKREAPGVYVDERKIASIGLRIKKNNTYHGLALNVDMDLEPFARINPFGYQNLQMTDIATWLRRYSDNTQNLNTPDFQSIGESLLGHLITNLGYSETLVAKAC